MRLRRFTFSTIRPYGLALTAVACLAGRAHALDGTILPHPKLSMDPQVLRPALPDLAVEDIRLDERCRVAVTVVNKGPGPVPDGLWTRRTPSAHHIFLSVDGGPGGGAAVWEFDPARGLQKRGGSAVYTSPYVVTASATVKATVDYTGELAEADERNNTLSKVLSCPDRQDALPQLRLESVARPVSGMTVKRDEVVDADPAASQSGNDPQYDNEADWAGDGWDPTPWGGSSAVLLPPDTGGSLLNSGLPPPPQGLPAPSQEDHGIEPGELLVISAGLEEAKALAQQARALGFGIKRRRNLHALGFVVSVLRPPKEVRIDEALAVLREHSPRLWADANHRYRLLGERAKRYPARLVGWRAEPDCGRGLSLGMIDTLPEVAHPVLQGRRIITRSFLPAGVRPAPPDHGTAVAALLVGDGPGLLPQAQLYAAGVFRQRDKKTIDTTAELIVAGLDWLVTQKVRVINLGLGGPRNLLIEAAVARVLEAGVAVTAAAGNGGPQAPPVYPAAQSGVVAVTAVDAGLAPYRRANRGGYIDFAAPGVDVWTAAPGGDRVYATGTSYAVPFVTAALAAAAPGSFEPEVLAALAARARDLGEPGRDPVFGWGLIQASCGWLTAGMGAD